MTIASLLSAVRAAEAFANSPLVHAAEAAVAQHESVIRAVEKHSALLRAEDVQFAVRSAIEKSFAVTDQMAKLSAPMFEMKLQIEVACEKIAKRQAVLQEAVERWSVPREEPELRISPMLMNYPAVMPSPRFRAVNPLHEELPERTIIRKEVKRRVGFAPYDDQE